MDAAERFGTLTPRMQSFKDELITKDAFIDATRAVIATRAYREHANEPLVVRRAYMLKAILEQMPIFIEPQTLIVGNQARENRGAPIFPEYSMGWVIDELDEFARRDGDAFQIDEQTKRQLREIAPFWEGQTVQDRALAYMPPLVRAYYDLGIIKCEGNITSGDGHLSVNYEHLVNHGLVDYERRCREAMDALELTDHLNVRKWHFYRAVLIDLEAVRAFAGRYAALARQMIESEPVASRKAELKRIADVCERVPYERARSFYEAVQSVWFVQLVLHIESNGHSTSYGRLDQYLCPFWCRDIDSGAMSEAEGMELLSNLWLKTYTINKVRSWSHTQFSAGSPLYQNVTIAGVTPEGNDGVNRLTWAVLRSVAQSRLNQPNLTVRYFSGMSDEFLDECFSVIRLGFGMPSFNNDEVVVPAYVKKGVALADARNYAAIGCMEVATPGVWGYRIAGMSFINMPRVLLIAMSEGRDPQSGRTLIKGIKPFSQMATYDELKAAWDACIREVTRQSVVMENCCDDVLERLVPDAFCSALVDDCIARGKTIKEGGAKYDFIAGLQVGMANLADSLAAIKKLVYDEGRIGKQELLGALASNFEGKRNQEIRQMLINDAPKWGNDDDAVDALLLDAYSSYVDEVEKYPNTRAGRGPIGCERLASTGTISANVGQGKGTMATPDGRLAFEPLAEGSSPFHGMDVNGPTAVFKTLGKLPVQEMMGGVLLNQKVTPQMLDAPGNKEKLELAVRTYFDRLNGYHVQYNVVSRETLLDAQAHPDQYRDLVVRVAGYSAFWNVLSKETQDDIIARTEQQL